MGTFENFEKYEKLIFFFKEGVNMSTFTTAVLPVTVTCMTSVCVTHFQKSTE